MTVKGYGWTGRGGQLQHRDIGFLAELKAGASASPRFLPHQARGQILIKVLVG